MKKIKLLVMVLIATAGIAGYVIGVVSTISKTSSDEAIVMEYIIDEHGDGNYEVDIYHDTDDGYINYIVYEDGESRWIGYIDRAYYTNLYTK